ncbi:hypothetical protein OAF42_02185 [Planctomicrobium sp.]|jgi:hypothetical protein|nr:hypothetical protein [Planctomicrobium sp.]MBT5020912.1 hypothetical protein [Planctomicrobium sp.]MDB4733230.1 hypothetical protein [Planctomicrobium sp.]
MKKRYTGGFAVVIFGLGFLLSQFWNFGGLGTGENENSNDGDQPATSSNNDEDAGLSNVTAGGNLNSTTSGSVTDPPEQPDEVITVVIHENYFRMTSEADPQSGVDVSLSEVVRQVSEATGGDQGVKLRILFERNAQEGALADLHAALLEKGVKRESVQEITGYVD